MSTITSPRLSTTSLTQTTPSSSRRPSLDNPTRSQTSSPSRPAAQAHPQQRRNRAALRDYYGLKATAAAAEDAGGAAGKEDEGVEVPASELDREGFDPEAYVKELLETEGLEGVLRVEGRLVNDIRALDGEKKALVYDNYSKLISATDTIRNMRAHMDPLAPTTSTLAPAIAHIAESSAALAKSMAERTPKATPVERENGDLAGDKEKQRTTARWVVEAPERMRRLVREGKGEEATAQWADAERLLDKWTGVQGVEDVRREGRDVLQEIGGDDGDFASGDEIDSHDE